MKSHLLLTVGLFAEAAFGSALKAGTRYAVKDSFAVPSKWKRYGPAPSDHTIELRIGLRQGDFKALERHLYEVSDPDHPRYGQHLSEQDVQELIRPSANAIDAVHEWLADNGISEEDCHHSHGQDWITVPLTVERVENLLDTKYSTYRHEDGSQLFRTPIWSLPEHLHDYIDTIQPTNSFFRARPKAISLHAQKLENMVREKKYFSSFDDVGSVCVKTAVTPDCLRTLYGTIDYDTQANDTNIMGLTDYLDETNNRSDTYLFLSEYRPEAKAAAYEFTFDVINNGSTVQVLTPAELEDELDVEGDLDVETMLGIGWPTPLVAYTVGGSPPFTADDATPTDTNEPYLVFLESVMSIADADLAKVISTSYDDDEQTVPFSYANRTCQEFAQLGARGVSLFFAAGDSGVGADGECTSNNGTGKATFLAEFLSSCPYITSVGATMDFNPEVVAYDPSGYAGGGGFSWYFDRPSYQDSVVPAYVESLDGAYAGLYNPSGRAYPDLAAQGYDFITTWDGEDYQVSGTSAATPAVSAVFALVNDALIAAGKSPLGFLNPWLYKYGYTAFTDITSGSAKGCSDVSDGEGFPAQTGWDAVTGWGTPQFASILGVLGINGTFSTTSGYSTVFSM